MKQRPLLHWFCPCCHHPPLVACKPPELQELAQLVTSSLSNVIVGLHSGSQLFQRALLVITSWGQNNPAFALALLKGDRGKHTAYLIFTSFQLRFSRSGVMIISNPLIRTNERNQSETSPLKKHGRVAFRQDVNEICTLLIILLFFVRTFWRNEGFYFEACRWN